VETMIGKKQWDQGRIFSVTQNIIKTQKNIFEEKNYDFNSC